MVTATMAVPNVVREAEAGALVAAKMLDVPIVPALVKDVFLFLYAPKILRRVNELLSGEDVSRLSPAEVKQIARVLADAYQELDRILDKFKEQKLKAAIFKKWIVAMEAELERLADVAEAFELAADDDIRVCLREKILELSLA